MAKYQVRIEDYEFEQTFTLDELLEHGLLDDDDPKIKVRAVGENEWVAARQYPFDKKEKKISSGFTINADGSVTRHTIPNHSTTTSRKQKTTSTSPAESDDLGCSIMIWIVVLLSGALLAIII